MSEVAKEKSKCSALAVNMFEADAGKCSQNMTQEDLALPFSKSLGSIIP